MSIIEKFKSIAAGSNIIYDTSALIEYSHDISDILKISNVGHQVPNEVINELDALAKSGNAEARSAAINVAKVLFELPTNTFDIIRAVYIDDRYKNEDKKIQEVIEIVNNWDAQTYICSADNLFKMRVKHLNIEKINFIDLA